MMGCINSTFTGTAGLFAVRFGIRILKQYTALGTYDMEAAWIVFLKRFQTGEQSDSIQERRILKYRDRKVIHNPVSIYPVKIQNLIRQHSYPVPYKESASAFISRFDVRNKIFLRGLPWQRSGSVTKNELPFRETWGMWERLFSAVKIPAVKELYSPIRKLEASRKRLESEIYNEFLSEQNKKSFLYEMQYQEERLVWKKQLPAVGYTEKDRGSRQEEKQKYVRNTVESKLWNQILRNQNLRTTLDKRQNQEEIFVGKIQFSAVKIQEVKELNSQKGKLELLRKKLELGIYNEFLSKQNKKSFRYERQYQEERLVWKKQLPAVEYTEKDRGSRQEEKQKYLRNTVESKLWNQVLRHQNLRTTLDKRQNQEEIFVGKIQFSAVEIEEVKELNSHIGKSEFLRKKLESGIYNEFLSDQNKKSFLYERQYQEERLVWKKQLPAVGYTEKDRGSRQEEKQKYLRNTVESKLWNQILRNQNLRTTLDKRQNQKEIFVGKIQLSAVKIQEVKELNSQIGKSELLRKKLEMGIYNEFLSKQNKKSFRYERQYQEERLVWKKQLPAVGNTEKDRGSRQEEKQKYLRNTVESKLWNQILRHQNLRTTLDKRQNQEEIFVGKIQLSAVKIQEVKELNSQIGKSELLWKKLELWIYNEFLSKQNKKSFRYERQYQEERLVWKKQLPAVEYTEKDRGSRQGEKQKYLRNTVESKLWNQILRHHNLRTTLDKRQNQEEIRVGKIQFSAVENEEVKELYSHIGKSKFSRKRLKWEISNEFLSEQNKKSFPYEMHYQEERLVWKKQLPAVEYTEKDRGSRQGEKQKYLRNTVESKLWNQILRHHNLRTTLDKRQNQEEICVGKIQFSAVKIEKVKELYSQIGKSELLRKKLELGIYNEFFSKQNKKSFRYERQYQEERLLWKKQLPAVEYTEKDRGSQQEDKQKYVRNTVESKLWNQILRDQKLRINLDKRQNQEEIRVGKIHFSAVKIQEIKELNSQIGKSEFSWKRLELGIYNEFLSKQNKKSFLYERQYQEEHPVWKKQLPAVGFTEKDRGSRQEEKQKYVRNTVESKLWNQIIRHQNLGTTLDKRQNQEEIRVGKIQFSAVKIQEIKELNSQIGNSESSWKRLKSGIFNEFLSKQNKKSFPYERQYQEERLVWKKQLPAVGYTEKDRGSRQEEKPKYVRNTVESKLWNQILRHQKLRITLDKRQNQEEICVGKIQYSTVKIAEIKELNSRIGNSESSWKKLKSGIFNEFLSKQNKKSFLYERQYQEERPVWKKQLPAVEFTHKELGSRQEADSKYVRNRLESKLWNQIIRYQKVRTTQIYAWKSQFRNASYRMGKRHPMNKEWNTSRQAAQAHIQNRFLVNNSIKKAERLQRSDSFVKLLFFYPKIAGNHKIHESHEEETQSVDIIQKLPERSLQMKRKPMERKVPEDTEIIRQERTGGTEPEVYGAIGEELQLQKDTLRKLLKEQEMIKQQLHKETFQKEIVKEVMNYLKEEWRITKLRYGR